MAERAWYYVVDEQRMGPVDEDELLGLLRSGLPHETLVWKRGLKNWAAASAIAELSSRLTGTAPTRTVGVEDMVALGVEAAERPLTGGVPVEAVLEAEAAAEVAAAEAAVQGNPFIEELRRRYEMNSRVFAQLAEELRKEGQLEEAVRICRDGLAKHPTYHAARVTIGRALMDLGEYDGARGELEAVLQATPGSLAALRALGECLERLGDLDGARTRYSGALALAPDDAQLKERVRALEDGGGPREPEAAPAGEAAAPVEEEDLPPIPLVAAPESFELENPYDVPLAWAGKTRWRSTAPSSQESAQAELAVAPSVVGGRRLAVLEHAPGEEPQADGFWPARSLAENDFPDLLQELHAQRWTGTLQLIHEGVTKTVKVEKGRLVFANSSSPDDRLGELLLRQGGLTIRQLADASAGVKPGTRLGTVLVEMGVLSAEDLFKVVIEHAQEILYSLFTWTSGLYRMKDGADKDPEAIPLRLSTPDVILQGIRRIQAWSRIERAVGGLATRYVHAPGHAEELKRMTLSAEQSALFKMMEQPIDVDALCELSSLSNFELCRTLWAFRVIGVISRVAEEPS